MNVIEASGLGKRYRGSWALRECTLAIPAGHVAALVGPNGAGKTTLLNMAVGLVPPSAGAVTVLGGRPAGSPAALDGIAFVAQPAMNEIINNTWRQVAPVVNSVSQKYPAYLSVLTYLTKHGYTQWTSYQPASRCWPFQWIEGGWLLALSVLLIAATAWLVRHRAAR